MIIPDSKKTIRCGPVSKLLFVITYLPSNQQFTIIARFAKTCIAQSKHSALLKHPVLCTH